MKTWVVVGSRVGARIFEHKGPGKGLALVQSLSHPEGRKLNADIDSDRSGRTFNKADRSSSGGAGHSMGKEVVAHDQEAIVFARKLAATLHDGRVHQAFERIVLVAEPRFLGMLREALDPTTSKLVADVVNKDLDHVAAQNLAPHLASVLAV